MHGMIIPLVGNGGQGFSAFHDAFLGFFRRSGDANMAERLRRCQLMSADLQLVQGGMKLFMDEAKFTISPYRNSRTDRVITKKAGDAKERGVYPKTRGKGLNILAAFSSSGWSYCYVFPGETINSDRF